LKINKIFLDSIDSTNTYAKNHANEFASDALTCIIAEEQTAGRGQFGRKWISPRGVNLYVTLFFHLSKEAKQIETLAIFMAKCLKDVLERNNIPVTLKWPNDLLLNGKKLAGVLCETVFNPDSIQVILGFGLNVNMEEIDLLQIDQKATSLKQETGVIWNKETLLEQILAHFLTHLTQRKELHSLFRFF
jgi:BirA family transcriptional regulator, biotin operon repressor / biotin---[acetyl-CoA-carboxylase] ligase